MLWGVVLDNGLKIRKCGKGKIYSLAQRCQPRAMLRFRTKAKFAYTDPIWNGLVCSLIGDQSGFLLIDKWPDPILFVGSAVIGTLVKCTLVYTQYGPQATLISTKQPVKPKLEANSHSDLWSWQRIVPLTTRAIKI